MELGKKYIKKLPAGVEDLLLDATTPYETIQIRGGRTVTITKINIDTIPAVGKYGEQGFQSIRDYIDELISTIEGSTDELVKVNYQDTNAGYLVDKMNLSQFEVDSNRIKIKDSVLKIESMNDLHLESRNNGYALFWDETLNKYVHKPLTLDGLTSDDFLKLDQSNPQIITNGAPFLNSEITASSNVLSLVNKKYVDFAVASVGTLRYYLSGITNSYGAYEIYLSEPQSDTYSFSFTNVDDGDLLLSFETNVLEIDKIYAGVLNLIVNAQKTSGTQDVRLYWKLKGRDSSGNLSVILSESDESDELKNSMSVENIPIIIVDDIDISGYDSLIIELYAKVSGWGSSPDIEISVGNNTNTTFTLPVPAEGLTVLYARKNLSNVSSKDVFDKVSEIDARQYSTLSDLVAAVGSADVNVVFVENFNVNEDVTIPENIHLIFKKGGQLTVGTFAVVGENVGVGDGSTTTFTLDNIPILNESENIYVDGVVQTRGTDYIIDNNTGEIIFIVAPASGAIITADYTKQYVLTINGSINAGLYQIFKGEGKIIGSSKIKEAYPEWFGAIGDGVADDYLSIRHCLDTFNICKLSSKTYRVSNPIEIYSNQTLEGVGEQSIILNDNEISENAECILVGNMQGDSSAFVEDREDLIKVSSAGVVVGSFDIVVDDVSKFNVGDLVWLQSEAGYTLSSGKFIPEYQQISKIKSIDIESLTITLEDPAYKDFSGVIYVCKNSPYSNYFLSEFVTVKNIKFIATSDTWYRLGGAYKCTFENIYFEVSGTGIVFNGAAYCSFKTIKGKADKSLVDLGHFVHHTIFYDLDIVSNPISAFKSAIGIFEGSHNIVFDSCKFKAGNFADYYLINNILGEVKFDKCDFIINNCLRLINVEFNNKFNLKSEILNCNFNCKETSIVKFINDSHLTTLNNSIKCSNVNSYSYVMYNESSVISKDLMELQGAVNLSGFNVVSLTKPTIIEDIFSLDFPSRDSLNLAKTYAKINLIRKKELQNKSYFRGAGYSATAEILNQTIYKGTLTSTEMCKLWCYGKIAGNNDVKTVTFTVGSCTYTYTIPASATKFYVKGVWGSTNWEGNYQRFYLECYNDIDGVNLVNLNGNDDLNLDLIVTISVDVVNSSDVIYPEFYGIKWES